MSTSLVYSSVPVYRLVMNVLYAGRYRQRFLDVAARITPDIHSVCELCFGDTILADWSRARGIEWTGVDLNERFCEAARRRGHRALAGSVFTVDLPNADAFVMAGSLYHFHARLPELFDRIWSRTDRLILSEPVRNLSSRRNPLGWWGRRSADAGEGGAEFRFDQATLFEMLRTEQHRSGLDLHTVSVRRDALVELRRLR